MKQLLIVLLLPLALFASPKNRVPREPFEGSTSILRDHDPAEFFKVLAEERSWVFLEDSTGRGGGNDYGRKEAHFMLAGDFGKEDNPMADYDAYMKEELAKIGVPGISGGVNFDEDNGFFQTDMSYRVKAVRGHVRATAVLDHKGRYQIDVLVMEFLMD